jgi:small GTP-binding protein
MFRQRLVEQQKQAQDYTSSTSWRGGPTATSALFHQQQRLQQDKSNRNNNNNPQNQRNNNDNNSFHGNRNPAAVNRTISQNQRNDVHEQQQQQSHTTTTNTIRNMLAQQQLGNQRNDNSRGINNNNNNRPFAPQQPPPQTFANQRNDNRRHRRNDNNAYFTPQTPQPQQQQQPSAASSIRQMLARTQNQQQPRTMGERRVPREESHSSSISNMLQGGRAHAAAAPQPVVTSSSSSSSAKSIRDMLVATASSASPSLEMKRDLTDVSNLREVFLKSIEIRKEQMQNEQQQQRAIPQNNNTLSQPAWRRDGAKGFRKRLQEQQKVETIKLEQQKRMRAALNTRPDAFLMTLQDKILADQQQHYQLQTKKKAQEKKIDTTVLLPLRSATITELSALFRVKIDKLMAMLRSLGERPPRDDEHYMVDLDVMELMALELGLEPVRSTRRRRTNTDDAVNLLHQRRAGAEAAFENDDNDEVAVAAQVEAYEALPSRPPVVCIMGHVDHGKTTLMDALRQKSRGDVQSKNKTTSAKKSNKSTTSSKTAKTAQGSVVVEDAVAGTEAGGITQVISAFQVSLENQDNAVTFLDTPGHAAFRAMRESGSNAADVIVLVVAADDGVSPQTIEVINFYKSIVKGTGGGGGISMVVAMTKIDKHGIDITTSRQRIENQLLEHDILSESFGSSGGDSEYGPPVQVIPVSGLTGEGLDDLIEGLVLQSEVMDLRADEKAQAEGIVMDARMEKGVGVVADCIVRWGSLERGNVIVSGVHSGKVKALKDSTYIHILSAFV